MERLIKIDGRDVRLKCTVRTLFTYRQYFGTEYMDDRKECGKSVKGTVAYKLVWACAKTADPDILPPVEWLESFSAFDVSAAFAVASALLNESIKTVIKNEDSGADSEWVSHNVAACALMCGISYGDMLEMPIGFLLDTISAYCDIRTHKSADKPKIRKATQDDFDAFG